MADPERTWTAAELTELAEAFEFDDPGPLKADILSALRCAARLSGEERATNGLRELCEEMHRVVAAMTPDQRDDLLPDWFLPRLTLLVPPPADIAPTAAPPAASSREGS